jgi:putative flippase GtrA
VGDVPPVSERPVESSKLGRSAMKGEFIRFVIVRGICTVFSYGCYLLLLQCMTYQAAYVVSYIAGVALAYLVNSKFVFREPLRKRAAFRFPLVYIFQFVANLVIIRIAVEYLHIPASLAFAVSIGITIPITFVLSRWIIRTG